MGALGARITFRAGKKKALGSPAPGKYCTSLGALNVVVGRKSVSSGPSLGTPKRAFECRDCNGRTRLVHWGFPAPLCWAPGRAVDRNGAASVGMARAMRCNKLRKGAFMRGVLHRFVAVVGLCLGLYASALAQSPPEAVAGGAAPAAAVVAQVVLAAAVAAPVVQAVKASSLSNG